MDNQRQRNRQILIVDDDPAICRLFRVILAKHYSVREAVSGEEAIEEVAHETPDLVLLDIMMPGIDGYETCRKLKAAEHPPQIIMVSARSSTEEQARAFDVGADDYLIKPVDLAELRARVELHFRLLESQATTAALELEVDKHHASLKRAAAERLEQVLAIQDVAVFTLAKVAESRDNETGQHLLRLRGYAQILAKELAISGPYAHSIDTIFLDDLYRSSPLHDIGKVGIPDAILLKPGPLTKEEFQVMKRHTTIGGNILHEAVMQFGGGGFLTMAALVAQFHHERWDGLGYPAGMKGEEIPLPARIVSVADVFDALTSERPYKEAWTVERTIETILEESGKQFDPNIVAAFDRCQDKFAQVRQKHSDQNLTVAGAMAFLEHDLVGNC
ncbi:MAG: response regulator [Pirellulales bacterium]